MIGHEKTETAKGLLAQGALSHRQIAAQLGVSRQWIDKLSTGDVSDCEREQEDDRPPTASPLAEPMRCHCGALVYPPCVACAVRAGLEMA